MKVTTILALIGTVQAFPALVDDKLISSIAKSAAKVKRLNGINPGFDASKQFISTSGVHAFVAPGKTDNRGPCPGLNALANHGYLPHNGVATIQQFIDANNLVVGMGEDLGGFLSVYGAIFDGNLASWSIGGPTGLLAVVPLDGTPTGMSGSHNKYEADVSPTRGDLYQEGNDYLLVPSQFIAEYAEQASETEETSNYDIGALTNHRVNRFQESVSKNPYFFNGAFTGVLVQPAAFAFQYRFMANHSTEFPAGRLSQQNLKDWFSMTGTYPNFTYTPGHEKIPDNWYRRAFGDEYTIPFFFEDVFGMAEANPQFLDIGGNTGTTNSFTGIDIEDVTGGLLNAKTFAQGNNAACYAFQLLLQAGPDSLEGPAELLTAALSKLTTSIGGAMAALDCPDLQGIQASQYTAATQKYPGVSKLNSKGAY